MDKTSFYNRLEQSGLVDTPPVVFAQALQKAFWKITKVIFVDARRQNEGDVFMLVYDPNKDFDFLNLPSYMVPGSSYTMGNPLISGLVEEVGEVDYTALLCVNNDEPMSLEVAAQGSAITIKLTDTDFNWEEDSNFAYLLIAITNEANL